MRAGLIAAAERKTDELRFSVTDFEECRFVQFRPRLHSHRGRITAVFFLLSAEAIDGRESAIFGMKLERVFGTALRLIIILE